MAQAEKRPCPVCGLNMGHVIDRMDHILLEEHEECPTGHYSEDYVTGNYQIFVAGELFEWYYTDPELTQERVRAAAAVAIERAKLAPNSPPSVV